MVPQLPGHPFPPNRPPEWFGNKSCDLCPAFLLRFPQPHVNCLVHARRPLRPVRPRKQRSLSHNAPYQRATPRYDTPRFPLPLCQLAAKAILFSFAMGVCPMMENAIGASRKRVRSIDEDFVGKLFQVYFQRLSGSFRDDSGKNFTLRL